MALQPIVGIGPPYPPFPTKINLAPSFNATLVIDATGEKVALSGRVWHKDRASSKNITRIQFRWGTVVKASGSGLTLSLQDVDLANGPPTQPDGVQDQTVAIAAASVTQNTWFRSNALSATRPVAFGDLVSVVLEFDGGGRLGTDSFIISTLAPIAATPLFIGSQCTAALFSGGSWSGPTTNPNIVLEYDDGTYGTLFGAGAYSGLNSHTYGNATAVADEHAAVINVPFSCKVDGLWAAVNPPAGADFDLVLYSGTTPLATVSIDANAVMSASPHVVQMPIPEQTLLANTDYYVAVKPTTANTLTAYSMDVNDAAFWSTQEGGSAVAYTSRLDGGAWAAKTATRRLVAGVFLSALDDGAGGGAGGGGGGAILSRVRSGY